MNALASNIKEDIKTPFKWKDEDDWEPFKYPYIGECPGCTRDASPQDSKNTTFAKSTMTLLN